jgi:hypothetical protein
MCGFGSTLAEDLAIKCDLELELEEVEFVAVKLRKVEE